MTYKIGDTFENDENYSDRVLWADENGATIEDLGNGKYQLVRIIPQSIEERNDNIRALRERLYCQISDHLKSDYDEAVAREADNVEGLRQRWLASKDKIRADNPYIKGD